MYEWQRHETTFNKRVWFFKNSQLNQNRKELHQLDKEHLEIISCLIWKARCYPQDDKAKKNVLSLLFKIYWKS
jgi:hypothetical protein